MGDEERRDAEFLLEPPDLLAQGQAHLGVEGGQRLVEQQHARAQGEGPGQRDALLLAAGQLVRVALALVAEADQFQQLGGAGAPLGRADLAHAQSEGHVVDGVQMREEAVRLEHHAGVAAVGRDVRDVLAVHQYGSGVGVFEPREHAQRGGLAAAGRAEEGQELSGAYGQVEPVEGDGGPELAAQPPEFDGGGLFEGLGQGGGHVCHPREEAVRLRPPAPASARSRAQVTSRLSTDTATDIWACEPPTS